METPQAFFAPLEGSLEPDRRLPGQSGAGGSDGLLNEARFVSRPDKMVDLESTEARPDEQSAPGAEPILPCAKAVPGFGKNSSIDEHGLPLSQL